MKITKLACEVRKLKLVEPYEIAYETIDRCTNVFLQVETDTGTTGWGCAVPDLEITAETGESVMKAFKEVIEPLMTGADPFRFAWLMEEMKMNLPEQPAAIAMADMALHDIMAREAGVPLYKLLGGYRDRFATSITIGIMPLSPTLEKARFFLENGFRVLKLKGGKNLEEDIEKLTRMRELSGREIDLRFDANQGYTVDEAMEFIVRTKNLHIELFEQPTARENSGLMGRISRMSSVPIMADESLMTLEDIFRLTSKDHVDMINIKLMKVGGITEALHINSVAKSAGVKAMVGCMDESALGIAAALHFALARPNIIYADLDGHLDLIDDPFEGIITLKDGILFPSDQPGLGVQGL